MIVTCPNCSSRYKIDEARIKGRGAKITCPSCAHKFVVYREGEQPAEDAVETAGIPADIARRDFRQVGITWKVRKGIGLTYDFHDLISLREYLDDGQIEPRDVISYDAKEWKPLSEVRDLEAYFWDVWRRAELGEIRVMAAAEAAEDEDDSDAPTTIVGHGTSLADEIRKAVQEAKTPAPAAERASGPPPAAPPPPVAPVSPAAPVVTAAVPPSPTAPAAAPDPFAQLGRKAQAQQSGGSNTVVLVGVAIAILVVVAIGLWWSGVFGGTS